MGQREDSACRWLVSSTGGRRSRRSVDPGPARRDMQLRLEHPLPSVGIDQRVPPAGHDHDRSDRAGCRTRMPDPGGGGRIGGSLRP
jgi:hypothetical protein